jgi:lipopolysaccharide cholinephosphotransferase
MIDADALKVKEVQLNLLEQFQAFCEERKIKYFLTGGTCIGALRHHGYIPWDDDIDVSMLRDDYERFIQEFNASSKDVQCFTCTHSSDYPFPFAKIANMNTLLREDTDDLGYEIGIHIDLFPIDGISSNKLHFELHMRLLRFLINLIYIKTIKVVETREAAKNAFISFSKVLIKPIPCNTIAKSINAVARRAGNESSTLGGIMVWGYGKREIVDLKCFAGTLLVDFEHQKQPVPIGYDKWLASIYKNYMELPPIDKRTTHHRYKAYIK